MSSVTIFNNMKSRSKKPIKIPPLYHVLLFHLEADHMKLLSQLLSVTPKHLCRNKKLHLTTSRILLVSRTQQTAQSPPILALSDLIASILVLSLYSFHLILAHIVLYASSITS